MFTILEELCKIIIPSKLFKTDKRYNKSSAFQRLGFLLENKLYNDDLAQAKYPFIENKKNANIPLLLIAEEIIKKYENHPIVSQTGKLLPIYSNQKVKKYLKTIAD